MSTSSLEKVLRTYMGALATNDVIQNVATVCRRAGISRTTFYKHFESMADLDERFLHLYFVSYMGPPRHFANRRDLGEFYQTLVLAMRDQHAFFFRTVVLKEQPGYAARWLGIVDERMKVVFGRSGSMLNPALWNLHLEFGIGVIHRYLEMALAAKVSDLEELTHWMMEFLWGGLVRFKELAEGTEVPMDHQLNRVLDWRKRFPLGSSGEGRGNRSTPGR